MEEIALPKNILLKVVLFEFVVLDKFTKGDELIKYEVEFPSLIRLN